MNILTTFANNIEVQLNTIAGAYKRIKLKAKLSPELCAKFEGQLLALAKTTDELRQAAENTPENGGNNAGNI